MTIIITGGAGFIGCNFIKYIMKNDSNYVIVCYDNLTYASNTDVIKEWLINKNFFFIKGDVSDREKVFKTFEKFKPDIVVNFAAESHVDRSIENSKLFFKTNIIGTTVLLDACLKFGVKRFHQISTDEVYGDLPLDSANRFFEDSNVSPNNPYSASKASADMIVLSYYKTYGLPVTISRCTNNFGEHQFSEKLIPHTILNALDNKTIPVYGNGLNVRDWIYVQDHCIAIDLILKKGRTGQVYNVAGNNEKQNIEIVKKICKYLNKPEDLIKYVTDRKGHDKKYSVDTSKMYNELGWKPKYNFDTALKDTIDWYVAKQKNVNNF